MLSALILSITLAFAVQKMYALSEGTDPTISENFIKSYYGRSDKSQERGLSLGETKQRFAIRAS